MQLEYEFTLVIKHTHNLDVRRLDAVTLTLQNVVIDMFYSEFRVMRTLRILGQY